MEKQKPDYLGHRLRIRKKFLTSSNAELHDYELLEILLFAAFSRADTKPIAKKLLAKFGDISAVINADIERLKEVEGVGEAALTQIKIIAEISKRILKKSASEKPILENWPALLNFSSALLKDFPNEIFCVLFLDKKHCLIEEIKMSVGENDFVAINVKDVARKALLLHAASIVLLHNHPSGDLKPSNADIKITNEIISALKKLEISVLDHLIISKSGHFSFRENGFI